MRCHICNAVLTPSEVQWNSQHEDWDPCGRCLQAIDEVFNDRSEEEIEQELIFEGLIEEEPTDGEDADLDQAPEEQ